MGRSRAVDHDILDLSARISVPNLPVVSRSKNQYRPDVPHVDRKMVAPRAPARIMGL